MRSGFSGSGPGSGPEVAVVRAGGGMEVWGLFSWLLKQERPSSSQEVGKEGCVSASWKEEERGDDDDEGGERSQGNEAVKV